VRSVKTYHTVLMDLIMEFSYACMQDIWQSRLYFHLLSTFCKDIPQQLNGSDCGVFICMYARHLAEQISFSFMQSDINVISAFC